MKQSKDTPFIVRQIGFLHGRGSITTAGLTIGVAQKKWNRKHPRATAIFRRLKRACEAPRLRI